MTDGRTDGPDSTLVKAHEHRKRFSGCVRPRFQRDAGPVPRLLRLPRLFACFSGFLFPLGDLFCERFKCGVTSWLSSVGLFWSGPLMQRWRVSRKRLLAWRGWLRTSVSPGSGNADFDKIAGHVAQWLFAHILFCFGFLVRQRGSSLQLIWETLLVCSVCRPVLKGSIARIIIACNLMLRRQLSISVVPVASKEYMMMICP